jgi:uncharacterized membrane protein
MVDAVGVLLVGIGVIFTFPVFLYATACLYRDWVGFNNVSASSEAKFAEKK